MSRSSLLYVALGDSISIDDYAGGPGGGAASLLYRNLPRFPEFAGKDLSTRFPGIRFQMLASDGALAEDVATSQLYTLGQPQEKILAATLTCGGNDLLRIYGADLQTGEVAAEELRLQLDHILGELRRMAGPGGLLLAGNIYDPTDGVGDPEVFQGVPWPDGLDILDLFNEVIEEVADKHDALLVDIHAHFLGHGYVAFQDPDHPWHNPADPTLWYEQTIEPNWRGASEVRRLFWARVEEHFANA